jgi:hypothetical protein
VGLDGLLALALAYQGSGHSDLAAETMGDLAEYARSLDDPEHAPVAASYRARLSLLRGDPAPALALLASPPLPDENPLFWIEVPATTRCRALLAEGSGQSVDTARARLRELLGADPEDSQTSSSPWTS